jgi:putative transposase
MAIPHRGWTSNSTYFITASTAGKRHLLQTDRAAGLFVDVLIHYRQEQKYLLHEFVVMPDHFHLLLTPEVPLERAMQLIKGGFSYRAKREIELGSDIWETSFVDRRVRDEDEYERMKQYIRNNPVKAGLVGSAEEFLYSSASPRWLLDDVPQRLKPHEFAEP